MSGRVSRLFMSLGMLAAALPARAQSVQYTSPSGVAYHSQADTGNIKRAEAALALDPKNVQKIIALGVAQSGARQFREAIATFTKGIKIAPNEAMLYRWRGHRHLSVREFKEAESDLRHGFQLDSTNYGVLYHLGIVHFVKGDFGGSIDHCCMLFRIAFQERRDIRWCDAIAPCNAGARYSLTQ